MFSLIGKRLTYANVAMTLALVFAMTGGAYAASKFVITSTKQIKPSVLKQLQGKAGKTGANGANGAQGSPGANGKDGAAGPQGPGGPQGPQGPEGKTGTNGKNGLTGFTKTLPSKETETGVWSFGFLKPEYIASGQAGRLLILPISFNVPLVAGLSGSGCFEEKSPCQVHYINAAGKEVRQFGAKEVESTQCKGSVEEPTAEPGNLCIYAAQLAEAVSSTEFIIPPASNPSTTSTGTGTAGAVLFISVGEGPATALGRGTWAVTAE